MTEQAGVIYGFVGGRLWAFEGAGLSQLSEDNDERQVFFESVVRGERTDVVATICDPTGEEHAEQPL